MTKSSPVQMIALHERYDLFLHLVEIGVDILQPVGAESKSDTKSSVKMTR